MLDTGLFASLDAEWVDPLLVPTEQQALDPDLGPLYAGLLMLHAESADSPTALAIAGVVGAGWARSGLRRVPIHGLDATSFAALLERHFPGAERRFVVPWSELEPFAADSGRIEEFDDLIELLMLDAVGEPQSARDVAFVVATACMRDDHLWQDLGLPNRRVLGALLDLHFAPLARRNVGDMKWKKFFYKQLCERAEIFLCRSPSCAVCVDYLKCFGPEE